MQGKSVGELGVRREYGYCAVGVVFHQKLKLPGALSFQHHNHNTRPDSQSQRAASFFLTQYLRV